MGLDVFEALLYSDIIALSTFFRGSSLAFMAAFRSFLILASKGGVGTSEEDHRVCLRGTTKLTGEKPLCLSSHRGQI